MNHSEFKGSYYQAGFNYGQNLLNKGITLTHLPIIHNEPDRLDYVQKSKRIYEVYYPEILEEIYGIADGQQMDRQLFIQFLLSMYSYTAENFCTSFVVSKQDQIFFGRNSDFACHLEESYDSCYYNLEDQNAFIGNTTSFCEMEDGVNEYGLAVGLTFIYPVVRKPGFNAGFLVRYLLEKCKSVEEAILALKTLPIGSSQTLVLGDGTGDYALVECNAEKMEIQRQPSCKFVVATNDFRLPTMSIYKAPIQDEIHSQERYETVQKALSHCKQPDLMFIENLLSGKMGFTCQYDRRYGMDTVWSSIYDLKNNKYYRAEGNPNCHSFEEDLRLNKK